MFSHLIATKPLKERQELVPGSRWEVAAPERVTLHGHQAVELGPGWGLVAQGGDMCIVCCLLSQGCGLSGMGGVTAAPFFGVAEPPGDCGRPRLCWSGLGKCIWNMRGTQEPQMGISVTALSPYDTGPMSHF